MSNIVKFLWVLPIELAVALFQTEICSKLVQSCVGIIFAVKHTRMLTAFGAPTSAQTPSRNQPSFLINFGVLLGLIWFPLQDPKSSLDPALGTPVGALGSPLGALMKPRGGPTQLQGAILVDLGSHVH